MKAKIQEIRAKIQEMFFICYRSTSCPYRAASLAAVLLARMAIPSGNGSACK
jgi:hypothetical protein